MIENTLTLNRLIRMGVDVDAGHVPNLPSPPAGPTAPGAPTGADTTKTVGAGFAEVAFTPPASDGGSTITGYTVTSIPDGITAAGAASPITVTGLTNGVSYTFTVHATNIVGNGPESNVTPTPATPSTIPDAPVIGVAVAGNDSATVNFTAPAFDGGKPIAGYTAVSSPAGGVDNDASSMSLSHSMSALVAGAPYTFTVTADNFNGTSLPSAPSNSVTPYTVPDAPSIGVATRGNAQVSVTFTPPVFDGYSAITGYTATSNPSGITSSDVSSPIVVTGLTNGIAYTFTVHATNLAGDSTESAPSNSATPATVPGSPTIGTAVAGNTIATVPFSAPGSNGGSSITGYVVASSPAGGTDANAGSTSLSHSMTGLTNGTAYTFTVTATNAVGTGAASSPSNSVTPSRTGLLTALSPATVAAASGPEDIRLSADGISAYVTQLTGNLLRQYSRNTSTMLMTSVATIATGNTPQAVRLVPDGTSVYAANYLGNTLSQYSRNTSTGTLTALSPSTISTGASSNPTSIATSPDGAYVYASCNGSGLIAQFSRNTSTGLLAALSPATISAGIAGNVQGMVLSPAGDYAYCATNDISGNGLIAQFSRNTSTGLLAALSPATISTSDANAREVIVSADGKSVYVTNLSGGDLAQFSRDTSTGLLSALSPAIVNTGVSPLGITIATDGLSVYVANSGDNTVSQYNRNTTTGVLTPMSPSSVSTGFSPDRITIAADDSSVYVTANGSNVVDQFLRN
jgi:trimeric autotransporter adhesin